MPKFKNPDRNTGLAVFIIIGIAIILDVVIMTRVTDRPLGLAADPAGVTSLAMVTEAAPVANNLEEIVPELEIMTTDSSGSKEMDVLGYGFNGGDLYLRVRLFEDIDFSLKKGWGKAFQLEDTRGKTCEYPCEKLPNAVSIHDPFIDLPNDLRAAQKVVEGGYKELYLVFENYPSHSVPKTLRVIEDFQGDSPANPGITYAEETFSTTGKTQKAGPVKAWPAGMTSFQGESATGDSLVVKVNKLWIDNNYRPNLEVEVRGTTASPLKILSAVLFDGQMQTYGLLELNEEITLSLDKGPGQTSLIFEPFPATVDDLRLDLKYQHTGEIRQVIVEL